MMIMLTTIIMLIRMVLILISWGLLEVSIQLAMSNIEFCRKATSFRITVGFFCLENMNGLFLLFLLNLP